MICTQVKTDMVANRSYLLTDIIQGKISGMYSLQSLLRSTPGIPSNSERCIFIVKYYYSSNVHSQNWFIQLNWDQTVELSSNSQDWVRSVHFEFQQFMLCLYIENKLDIVYVEFVQLVLGYCLVQSKRRCGELAQLNC